VLARSSISRPWSGFTGVDLKRVLDSVGVPATATSIHVTALDDYQVDLTMDEIRSGEIVLATRQDGAAIPLDKGGPTRIVFGPGVASGQNPDEWIWSLALIEVHA
jgi:DMSO/TMAO reductase YedYZ molybdopterin-dependent catalytic subunit